VFFSDSISERAISFSPPFQRSSTESALSRASTPAKSSSSLVTRLHSA
jgi:hypothetical protein